MPSKVFAEITYAFIDVNGSTVEDQEWIYIIWAYLL